MPMRVAAVVAVLLTFGPALAEAKESPDPINRIFLIGDRGGWHDTGLRVRPQDRVTIRVGSQVCFSGGRDESCVRAAGWPRSSYAENWNGDASACEDPYPEWNHATVIARIGEEPFEVGKQAVVTGREGPLQLAINDCSFEGEHRNEGQFSVVVVVENPVAQAARSGRELIEAALDAMGGKAIRGVRSLGARAACSGPGGAFTTEVLSIFPHETLFRQSSDAGAIELVALADKAWRIDRELGKREPATKMLGFIRGHEFHAMLFELDTRFTDHTVPPKADAEEPGEVEAGATAEDGAGCVRVEMRDEYGAPAAVCLDAESHLPVRLSLQPGGKKKEPTIELELESWTEIDGVRYLEAFTLRQGDDLFTYRYEEILPNSVERSVFKEVSAATLEKVRKQVKRDRRDQAEGDPETGKPAEQTAPPEPPDDDGGDGGRRVR